MSTTLTLTGLGVAYGARTLVTGLDLVVAGGDVTALVGPNGSGKSSLMRTLVGELPVESGSVRLAPADATIGWLPQVTPDPDESLLDYARRRTGVAEADRALHAASEALAAQRGRTPTTSTPRPSSAGCTSAPPTSRTGCRRSPPRSVSTSHRTGRSAPSPAGRPPARHWSPCCSAGTTCCSSTSRPTTSTLAVWS